MRRVEVLLPPAKLDEVKDALADIGIDSMTLGEVKVVEPANHRREVYLGSSFVVDFALKVKMELLVRDSEVPGILAVLQESLRNATSDETRVLLFDVVEVIPLRNADEACMRTISPAMSARP
jgi:nitrogen regulatory protein PII